jgi:outer membrane protein assembly factor BamB
MKNIKVVILLILSLGMFQSCTQPANWSQYLGPQRNAIISATEILKEWPESGPKELWSFPLGEGYGGAAIFDDEVFILDRTKGESDILRCIDLNSGEEKWNYSYDAKGEISFPGSRTVPTVDKNHIWSVGPHGDMYCIDKTTHEPIWSHNFLKDFNRELTTWGVSQSPLIYEDLVIVAPQGDKAGVVAYNKISGELVWKTRPLAGHPFHASPTLANFGGVDQVIVLSPYDRRDSTKTNEVVAFDASSGEELWKYTGLKSFATITPAVVLDDQRLVLTDCSFDGGYDPVTILLEVTKPGEDFLVNELFLTEEAGCKMHPPILHENHLYLNSTGNPNQMVCMTMEGKLVWEKASAPGFEMGALILVGDMIINQNGKNGDIHLIDPSPEGFKETGKASLFSSGKSQAWAPLAFSHGKLIVRDLEKMVCVELTRP